MINGETRRKLRELNMGEFVKGLELQSEPATVALSFGERMQRLTDYALEKRACLSQIRTWYIRLPDLLMEYGDVVVMTGQQKKLLAKYSRIPLLIIDEWLVADISESELYFLFELMERRSDSTSTIFCTQYRKEGSIKRLGMVYRQR